ncbi:MAG: PUA domain-containing protein [Desulfurococcaceae archaeon]|uniref:Pseudouridine synthase n=1 Tax=Staphylothermus marinus TaxID=2280 RepID=A0A7C4JM29_STAMA
MIKRRATDKELSILREIANLQFRGYGDKLIPDNSILLLSPSTFKIRGIEINGELYITIRASDFRFILHKPSAIKLNESVPHPLMRVYVSENYANMILEGSNVFSKHVVLADPDIRPEDEVLIHTYPSMKLIAIGKSLKPGWVMNLFNWGEAVRVRDRFVEADRL